MFTQKTYFVSISFSNLNLSHFINEKLRGSITWLYQRRSRSTRLVQTGEEPIRLRRCRSEQPYFRTPYNKATYQLYKISYVYMKCAVALHMKKCVSFYLTSFTFKTPLRMLPPATPPLRSSTSQPGLLTSNDLITKRKKKFFDWNPFKKGYWVMILFEVSERHISDWHDYTVSPRLVLIFVSSPERHDFHDDLWSILYWINLV